jgi:DNA polymerase elongation subunit (family B)
MSHGRFGRENDRWGFTQASAIRVTGRHMINIWRAMRGELNLTQYTLENVTFHLLHRRFALPAVKESGHLILIESHIIPMLI